MKSDRNKTIDLSVEDGKVYLERCITPEDIHPGVFPADRVICGDTFSVSVLLPPESVDLLIADPPYNMSKNFGETAFRRTDADSYREYTRQWLTAVLPLLKKNASVYVCCDWLSSGIVGDVLGGMMTVRSRITWQREKGRGAKANWKNAAEDIWFATVSDDYTFNTDAVRLRRRVVAPYRDNGQPKDWDETDDGRFRDTCPSNFWDDISVPYWSMPENTAHPTQKPEKLIAKLILASSSAGGTVYDPFLGSGTTAVTAKKLGRHFCGTEINPQYCVWAQKRLEMAENDSSIQGYTGGVFWERNTFGEQQRIRLKKN